MTTENNKKENQKNHAPAVARNRDPILDILKDCLPAEGTILEIASGSGEHANYFTDALSPCCWLPSDPDQSARDSIRAWWWDKQLNNILPAVNIDCREAHWVVESEPPSPAIKAMVCINMLHISPWDATQGLIRGAERILPSGGILYLYGPYKIGGSHTAPSNQAFDQSLKSRNPEWGVRNLEDVQALAEQHGLNFVKTIQMPANNLSVIFKKD